MKTDIFPNSKSCEPEERSKVFMPSERKELVQAILSRLTADGNGERDRQKEGEAEKMEELEELEEKRGGALALKGALHFLPSQDEVIYCLKLLLELLHPMHVGSGDGSQVNLEEHMATLLRIVEEKLSYQVERSLRYPFAKEGRDGADFCRHHSIFVTKQFLAKLPALKSLLLEDAEAAYRGDPAASSVDEVILAYPGFLAVTVYRLANPLYLMEIPFIPRIMTEWAHRQTGADIHPGAKIGSPCFIDHATGVVIGETAEVGSNVKFYQGVTLGALSFPKDEGGQMIRGRKRHPTVEDGVTIYANATILGGDTIIGKESVIGGSVWVTKSVPPRSRVVLKCTNSSITEMRSPKDTEWVLDFTI